MKRLKRLKRLPGHYEREEDRIPTLNPLVKTHFDQTDDPEDRLAEALGDRELAKRVLKLKKEYPAATYPELVCVDFLRKRAVAHKFQVALLGGRTRAGGLVPDLVVFVGPLTIVWMVNGNYWHHRPGMRIADMAARTAIAQAAIDGKRVDYVVEIWERRVMDKRLRPQVLEAALQGIELGP